MAKFSLIVIKFFVLITIFELEKAQSMPLDTFEKNNDGELSVEVDSFMERYL